MSRFERTLNYSSVNEDWDTELRALRCGDGDEVLCITGSGARPLAVLARTRAARVVAVDTNPAQNHLLRLQAAAIRTLPYPDLIRWLGLEAADPAWRLDTWRHRISARTPAATRRWWAAHRAMIAYGVLYAGRWERHFRRVSRLARLIWPVETLFAFRELASQRRWLDRHWDDGLWRAAWRVVCHPRFSRLVFGDPGFHGRLDVEPGRFLYERMRRCLDTYPARASFMVSLVLRGELSRDDLPPHLTEPGAATIAERLHRLAIVDADLTTHLRAVEPERYSRFSLSDLSSFLDQAGFETLWREVVRTARPGARVVMREFLRRPRVPAGLPVRRESGLEAELARLDRAFGYDFIIGVVGERFDG